jgi:hypothetical protein
VRDDAAGTVEASADGGRRRARNCAGATGPGLTRLGAGFGAIPVEFEKKFIEEKKKREYESEAA